MAIQFPPLPFEMDALEPYMSKRTLEFHYGKHHKGYVDKLNKLIEGSSFENQDLESIVRLAKEQGKTDIFNNAGQAWNHDFFWNCLAGKKSGPSKNLEKTIAKNFGTFDGFKEKFATAGKKLFGSGWVWLVKDDQGHLKIQSMANAENPLVTDETPVLTCDVWEHAYYLDYQNERPKFLENFWNLVNWQFVESNSEQTPKNRTRVAPIARPDEHSRSLHH